MRHHLDLSTCCTSRTASLIAEWEHNNARVTVDPLPKHRYSLELLFTCGRRHAAHGLDLLNLLWRTHTAKHLQPKGTILVISRDGNFFTAKEV